MKIIGRSLRGSERSRKLTDNVAPFAGAWIEIVLRCLLLPVLLVAPFAGAWIEMLVLFPLAFVSLVAPFAGAWIEIFIRTL